MKASYKKYILTVAIAALGGTTSAQTLNSAYFTDDYKFRHTMNPAYGNDQSYFAIPALGNLNVKLQGNFGYQDVIMENPLYPLESVKKMTTFMNPYIATDKALGGLSTGNNRIAGDVGITLFSAGFKAWGGYNTLEINSKTAFGLSLPYELFEFARNIGNNNYNIGDIDVNAQSYVELALGHSRDLNDKLRVGAKLKFMLGLARADLKFLDVKAELASNEKWVVSGQAQADVSVKGFTYKSTMSDYEEEGRGQYEHIDDVDVDGTGLNGFGMAVDLGAVYKINDDWTVSAALIDLGFINWNNNMQAVNLSDCFEFDGFHDVAVTGDRGGEKLGDKTDRYADQLAEFANLKDNGDQGGRTTGIGATINIGAEYTLPVYRRIKFGALSSTRLRGAYSWTEGRLSANYTPLSWIDGGVSFAVNSFATSMGWVINIHPKGYNFFIGMDHLLGKMSKEAIPLSSNANVSLGMSITW